MSDTNKQKKNWLSTLTDKISGWLLKALGIKIPETHSRLEELFESLLYSSRFLVLFAVIGTLLAALVMFLQGSVEIIQGLNSFIHGVRFTPNSADDKLLILSFIPAIDNYLFATILLIFSMGIYELFISKIDPEWRKPNTRPSFLFQVNSLDDLKTNIGKVVIMILIVYLFQLSLELKFNNSLDILCLSGAILIVAIALVITYNIQKHKESNKNTNED